MRPNKIIYSLFLAMPVCLFAAAPLLAQQKIAVQGVVRDATDGQPVAGASVIVKGTTIGTMADGDGKFTIETEPNNTLVVNFIGYAEQEIWLNGQTVIAVNLNESAIHLEEVVKIGYGTTTKKEITGSVASIKAEDFNKGTFTTAAGMLQGKVAGLSIVNPNGGDPNGQYEMLLRGSNTLMGGQGPLVIIDGMVGADMRSINFQEVESIDVLKDGSAAAIYGTRGTNGVVIITTKRARAGTMQVEYDGQVSVQTVTRRPIPMTADEFKYTINNYVPAAAASLQNYDTDWFDEITRTPVSHKHSFAVSGGAEKFSHRTVLNVEQNQGILQNNNADKYLFKSNIRQTAFEGWLDLDYNIIASKRKYNPSNTDAFRQAFFRNPTEPVYDASNTAAGGYYTVADMDYSNPVAMINETLESNRETDNTAANVRATLNILPVSGLKWDNFFSYNQERYEARTYRSRYYPSLLGTDGSSEIENSYFNELQWESTVNYSKHIDRHSLQAIAGYSYQQGISQSSSLGNEGFDTDLFLSHSIGSGDALKNGTADMYSYKESHKYIAFFGRAMYNYDEKYLASVSLRRDGSSRFGANNKWGWFPAVSLGWRITREDFMQNLTWLNELKLRTGFGVTGNQDIPNYRSLLLFKAGSAFFSNGEWVSTYTPKTNPNPDLRWEKKAEFNVGIDFAMWGGKISGTVDYYNRTTTDLLYEYDVPVPPYLVNTLMTNLGEINNQGIEVMLAATPVQAKNFKWNTSLTFSHNTNKLVKLTSTEFSKAQSEVGWIATPMGAYSQRIIEGESLGSFYAPVWEGIGSNGKDKLKGSIAGSVPAGKWEKIGTAYPDFVLGWSNSLTYKQWDLSAMMRLSVGGKVFNSYAADYENISTIGLKNVMASWLDNTDFTGAPQYSSKYIEDATYFKIDNVALGYTLNFNTVWAKKMRFSLSAQNILCLTGYKGVDPEVSQMGLSPGIEGTSYYPSTAVFTFGVNVVF